MHLHCMILIDQKSKDTMTLGHNWILVHHVYEDSVQIVADKMPDSEY